MATVNAPSLRLPLHLNSPRKDGVELQSGVCTPTNNSFPEEDVPIDIVVQPGCDVDDVDPWYIFFFRKINIEIMADVDEFGYLDIDPAIRIFRHPQTKLVCALGLRNSICGFQCPFDEKTLSRQHLPMASVKTVYPYQVSPEAIFVCHEDNLDLIVDIVPETDVYKSVMIEWFGALGLNREGEVVQFSVRNHEHQLMLP